MVLCVTLAHLSTTVYSPCRIHCSCTNMYACYPVTDKVFNFELYATSRVISGAITLASGVFFWESRSDTVCRGNHNTAIPVIDTARKAFWDAMFLQEEKGWTVLFLQMKNKWGWMENCRGMERDHYFCGSTSTTRSHTRNQDPPHWSGRFFFSMAAHFSAVSVAIITEIGRLKEGVPLAKDALDIHGATNSPLPFFFVFNMEKSTKS